jgi:hypothetical protein
MNIVQLHEGVRFWLDLVGSSRFDPSDIDNALNFAAHDLVFDKYEGAKKSVEGDSFQRTQKVRDELSDLVMIADTNLPGSITIVETPDNTLIPVVSFPDGYHYLLCLAIYDAAGKRHNCWPLTYDRKNVIDRNPYRRPRIYPMSKQYYNEGYDGINITHVFPDTPSRVVFYYLSHPIPFNYGISRDSTYSFIVNENVIATEDTVYAGTTYLLGTKFAVLAGTSLTSGKIIDTFTESNLNEQLHEDLTQKAAINLLLTIKEFDKAKALYEQFVI